MTEIAMNEYYIESDVRARYIRQAEEMRSAYIRALFVNIGSGLTQAAASAWKGIRSLVRRSRWNLSVPAPHR
jgi:hypothetical protein